VRISILCLCVLLPLFGCDKPKPANPPEGVDANVIDAVRAQKARENERVLLDKYPQLATRTGHTLTLRYADKEITTYTDDANGCTRYSVLKVLELRDNATGKLEPIAEVNCRFGYLDNNYLVLPTSDKFTIVADVAASTDGRWLAMDDNSIAGSRGDLTIVSWPDMTKVARFDARCDGMVWRDDKSLSAVCQHVNGPDPNDDSKAVVFRAHIFRADAGTWRMKGVEWLKPVSDAPLPTFEGIPPERYRDPLQITDTSADQTDASSTSN